MNQRVYIYNLNDTVDSYEIDEKDSWGITAIGYSFTNKDTGRRFYIHPSTVKRIEEEPVSEASLASQAPQKQ